MAIHIVSRNLTDHDAVSNFAMDLSLLLRRQGEKTCLYAQDIHLLDKNEILETNELFFKVKSGDVIFCNYSIFDEYFDSYIDCDCSKKILYYHNVTPGALFKKFSKSFSEILDASNLQREKFSRFDIVIANSLFSMDQITYYLKKNASIFIFPPYFNLKYDTTAAKKTEALCREKFKLLWVGRIAPHKRPDLALKIFDELVKSGVDASLTFVGGGRYDFPIFAEHIDACLAALPAEAQSRVQFMQNISDEQLAGLYKHSDLLLCTSAHEGYCMPLAEAAACNLPVAAMPQPAVLETLNGGGIILDESPQLAAQMIKNFLISASEEDRRAAIPVLKQLPTDELLRIVKGDA